MSGRSRVTLADGRRVTGYRKTLRQNPRSVGNPTPAHEAPLLRVLFIAPPRLMIPAGLNDMVLGVTIETGPIGNVSASLKTFNRDLVFAAVAAWLRRQARQHDHFTIAAVLTSSSDPSWSGKWSLTFIDGHVVATQSPTEPLVFPAAA